MAYSFLDKILASQFKKDFSHASQKNRSNSRLETRRGSVTLLFVHVIALSPYYVSIHVEQWVCARPEQYLHSSYLAMLVCGGGAMITA